MYIFNATDRTLHAVEADGSLRQFPASMNPVLRRPMSAWSPATDSLGYLSVGSSMHDQCAWCGTPAGPDGRGLCRECGAPIGEGRVR